MAQTSSRTTSSRGSPQTDSLACTPRSGRRTSTGTAYTVTTSSPKPYLLLRKASSEALRNGNLRRAPSCQHQDISAVVPSQERQRNVLDQNAGSILPSTIYVPPTKAGAHILPQSIDDTPNPQPKGRSRSFSENRASRQAVRNTILRAATSIPDYKAIKDAYKVTAATYPPNPQRPETNRAASIGQSVDSSQRSTFWRDGGADSLRASIRSAMTNDTSALEWSETEHSSVWTEASTASEFIPNSANWPLIKEEEMSAEDAIDMYANDFVEDLRLEVIEQHSTQQSRTTTHKTVAADHASNHGPSLSTDRSFIPPTAMSLPHSKPHTGSISIPQPQTQASSHVAAGHINHTPPVEDRLKALISVPRDIYGFKKQSRDITVAQYDVWNVTYTKYLERRRKKWVTLLKHHNLPIDNPTRFPPRSDKVKRYIRKGIPPEWRGAAWFWYAGGPAMLSKQAGVYDILLKRASTDQLSENDRDHIERDLHRTYPDNIHFKPDSIAHPTPSRPPTAAEAITPANQASHLGPDTPSIRSLRNVLRAFAIHNPKIGYCQSLNFLAGTLLLFLHNDEERAFHLLCILTSVHLPATHSVALEGANVDIGVLMMLLRDLCPALWAKVDDRADKMVSLAAGDMRVSTGLPTVSLATTSWFMSCFASTLPVETMCRVWDALFYEGSKTLFRVGLTVFKLAEVEIRKTSEPMEAFQVVQTLPRRLIDANLVMEVATGKRRGGLFAGVGVAGGKEGFGGVSQKMVERRREERRGLFRRERERVLHAGGANDGEVLHDRNSGSNTKEQMQASPQSPPSLRKYGSRATLKRLKSMRSPSKRSNVNE